MTHALKKRSGLESEFQPTRCVLRKTVASSELLVDYAALFDASFLAGEIAQIVKFCATNLTVLVDCDRVDERRFDGEDTLNTDVVADFTNGEALFVPFARDTDHYATVLLDTLFVTLFDAISHCDGVAGAKLGMCFAGSECFFGNFN